jgi:hypothetical protein
MDDTTEINLRVPAGREDCGTWIKSQNAETVAAVLDFSCTSWRCLQSSALSQDRAQIDERHSLALEDERRKARALEDELEGERRDHQNALIARLEQERERLALSARESDAQRSLALEEERRKILASEEQQGTDRREHERILQNRAAAEKARLAETIRESEERATAAVSAWKERHDVALRQHEAEVREMREDALKHHERKQGLLESELQSALEEVRHCRGADAIIRADAASHFELQRAQEAQDHQRAAEFSRLDHEREIRSLTERGDEARKQEDYFRKQSEVHSASLREAEEHNKRLLSECNARMENVLSRNSGSLTGKLGEDTVEQIFSTLCLGSWTNESGKALEGYGDALWTYDPNQANCARLQCLVEVKKVSGSLHSEHDIAKWRRDIVTGAKNGRINGGMLISLSAHIPDTRQVDLSSIEGVPVLRVSRAPDDPMPASSLVRVAFYCFAQVWPALCRQRVDRADATIAAVCDHMDAQADSFARLSKSIDVLEKHAVQMQRQIVSLKKTRDVLVSTNDCIRLNHPQLTAVQDAEEDTAGGGPTAAMEEEPWESESGREVIDAIRGFRQSHPLAGGRYRYPKSEADLKLSDGAVIFMQRMPNSMLVATKIVKDSFQVKKRKVGSDDAAVEEALDEGGARIVTATSPASSTSCPSARISASLVARE